jgi:lipid II:glycine glycyltransferase (peptidoglycan interpeptide bridge formation enzyme)
MFDIQVIEDQAVWEAYIATHPEANFLHSWYWGVFHERLGHTVIRHGYYQANKLVGVLQTIVEPARRGRHLTVPGGPILDWGVKGLDATWVKDLKAIAKAHDCVFARVRPQLLRTPENQQMFKRLGFRKAPMHLTADLTSQLDLTKTDDEIKSGMRKGARYDLNKSAKLGIKVEVVSGAKYLDEFYNLQLETAKRHNFVPFTKQFLTEQFKTFQEVDAVQMYRATYQGKLLTMAFIIFYGQEAAYHYGASTDLARQYPGAYAVQWEAIQEARRRGCQRYNFWGVTEHGNTKHRFYGVSVFKRGFGGDDVAYLPAQDLVVNRLKYEVTYAFETARRKARKL